MSWGVYGDIVKVLINQEFVEVLHEVVTLSDHVENGEEAVWTSWSILLRVVLKSEDSTVEEWVDVVSVKVLAVDLLIVDAVIIFLVTLEESVSGLKGLMNWFSVSNLLMFVSTTSLFNNDLVVEGFGNWMIEVDETSAIGSLHSSTNVSHQIAGCTSDVSTFDNKVLTIKKNESIYAEKSTYDHNDNKGQ